MSIQIEIFLPARYTFVYFLYIIAAQILFLRHFACFVAVIMQNDVDAFYTLSYNDYIDIVHTAQLYFISALQ